MAKKRTKTELKHIAQEMLMYHMCNAGYPIWDGHECHDWTQEEKDRLIEAMQKQVERVQKLFGYEPTGRLN